MIFLITGGSSFLGVTFAQLLVKEGHVVYLACRKASKRNLNIPINDNVHVIYYEGLCEIESIAKYISYIDIFIHLAWDGTGHEGRDNEELQQKNITYSLTALNVAKKLKCKLFVGAGSQAEYGKVNTLITENTICRPECEYGKAKLEFGNIASERCSIMGMKYIHLRIFSLFGENDHPWTLVMSCIRKMLNNEDVKLSSCEQLWNFLYVKDAVKQIYLLCNHVIIQHDFKHEVYNIASNDTRKLRNFVEDMYQLTESKSVIDFGGYRQASGVSLIPSVDKIKIATGGFISDYDFNTVINRIINKYKRVYDKS